MSPEDMHNEDHFEGKNYGHKEMDAMFETLLHPPNLILQFRHMDEFADWTRTGTIEDIDEMRKEFEKFELYGYLIVIRDILIEKREEEKLNAMLDDNGIG
jgi:hypothetical protein